jgi:hypothetical protein
MKMILRKNDDKGLDELYEIMVNEDTDPSLAISVLEVTLSQMKKFFGIEKVRIDWVK